MVGGRKSGGEVGGENEVGGGRVDGGRTDVSLVDVGVKERDRGLVGLVFESGTEGRTDQSQSVSA